MQWLYEAFYSAIGELFADINDLGVEIFDLSWVQAVVSLFAMLGWSLFVVGVVLAVFEVAIESQSGRVNVKGTALNVLKGFFAASLVGVLPVQLYKSCCHLQGIFTADLAGLFAVVHSSTRGAFGGRSEAHILSAGLCLLRDQGVLCQHQAGWHPLGTDGCRKPVPV